MSRVIDAISDFFGLLAGWLFFAIGVIICYEMIARYMFSAPTIWAEKTSRFLENWAVFVSAMRSWSRFPDPFPSAGAAK